MDWVPLFLPLITMLPILVLCKAGKPKEGSGAEDGLSTLSTLSGTTRTSTASNMVDSGTSSARAAGKSDKEKPKVEAKEDTKLSPLKSPLGFHKEIVVPIGKASVETPMKSNMSKRENRKRDSSRTSSKRVVRFK